MTRDVIVLGLIWGASVVLQRVAVTEMPPLWLATWRVLAAVAFFLPFVPRIWRALSGNRRLLFDLVIIGALNPGASAVFSALALQHLSSGMVAILAALAPLTSALIVKLLPGRHPLKAGQVGGLAAAFLGVVLLIGMRSTGLADETGESFQGHILALMVAFALALSSVYADRRIGKTDPLALAAGQMAAAMILVTPAAILLSEPMPVRDINPWPWTAVIISGAIGLGASFILLLGIVKRYGPTAALLSLYVTPVAASILGVLLLGETITLPMAAGAGLILLGLVQFNRTWSAPSVAAPAEAAPTLIQEESPSKLGAV